jgi:hypothetical protein
MDLETYVALKVLGHEVEVLVRHASSFPCHGPTLRPPVWAVNRRARPRPTLEGLRGPLRSRYAPRASRRETQSYRTTLGRGRDCWARLKG